LSGIVASRQDAIAKPYPPSPAPGSERLNQSS